MSLTLGSPEIRREIDSVIYKHNIREWADHLPAGVSFLSAGSSGKDCEDYAFGLNGIMAYLLETFPDVETPEVGDIVCYCKTGVATHVGRYQADGSVKSKWGGGPIFRHHMDYVPTYYGNMVVFRRATRGELRKLPEMARQKREAEFIRKYTPTKK